MTVSDVLDVILGFDSALASFFGVVICAWLIRSIIRWFSRTARGHDVY